LRTKVAQLAAAASQRAPVTNADPNASVATAVPTSRPASCITPSALRQKKVLVHHPVARAATFHPGEGCAPAR